MAKDQKQFDALVEQIRNNQVGGRVELSGCELTDTDAEALASALLPYKGPITLGLYNNKIGEKGAEALAKALQKYPSLTHLIFGNNPIGDTGMEKLAQTLKNLAHLTFLGLRDIQISEKGAKDLAQALEKHSSLTHLDLDSNWIGDEGMKKLTTALQEHKGLEFLMLDNIQVSEKAAKDLGDALKDHGKLTVLSLGYNQIGDKGVKDLALQKHSNLRELFLQNNSIGPEGAKALARALQNHSGLNFLHLSDNQIGPEGAKALAQALQKHSNLTRLSLAHNQIGPEGAKALAQTLQQHSNLTELGLSDNQIGKEGVKELSEALEAHKGLTILGLESNQIEDEGISTLIEALSDHQRLTHLGLSDNQIGGTGIALLAEWLESHPGLTYLSLGNNKIGEHTGGLAEVLQNHEGLSYLDLSQNQMGDEGVKKLAAALKEDTTLITLNLWGNPIGNEGAEALVELLKVNSTLTSLNLGNSDIDPEHLRTIEGYLAYNRQHATSTAAEKRAFVEAKVEHRNRRKSEIRAHLLELPEFRELQASVGTLQAGHEQMTERMNKVEDLTKNLFELEQSFEALKKPDISAELKVFRKELDTMGSALDHTQEQSTAIINTLQNMRSAMQLHVSYLNTLKEQESETNNQLEAVLARPRGRLYYCDMFSNLNQLYLASQIAGSGYFTPNKKGWVKVRKLIDGVRNTFSMVGLSPAGGAGGLLSMIVQEHSEEIAKGELKNFADLARGSKNMDAIFEGVSRELAFVHQEDLSRELCKEHLTRIMKAVIKGDFIHFTLKGLSEDTAVRNNRLIAALANVAEDKPIDAPRELHLPVTSTPAVTWPMLPDIIVPGDPDRENAFNQLHNTRYWYQAADFKMIHEGGFLKDFPLSCLDAAHLATHLEEMLNDATREQPVLCAYNKGGKHWVSIAIGVDAQGKKTVLYKDSLGEGISEDLQTLFTRHGVAAAAIKVHTNREQIEDSSHCGLFALENLSRMAGILSGNSQAFIDDFAATEFCTLAKAQTSRDTFANFYFEGVVRQMVEAQRATLAELVEALCTTLNIGQNSDEKVKQRFIAQVTAALREPYTDAEAIIRQTLESHQQSFVPTPPPAGSRGLAGSVSLHTFTEAGNPVPGPQNSGNALETKTEMAIRDRLTDIYGELFEALEPSKAEKITRNDRMEIKDRLRQVVLNIARTSSSFRTSLLERSITDICSALKSSLEARINPSATLTVEDTFIKAVVNDLVGRLLPQQQQRRRRSNQS